MKLKTKQILLFLIILLAFFLRFYKIDSIPGFLNRDEAAIGYNAYCLLKTGKDEYNQPFPLFFKSFGDWKMPVYIYATTPSVAIFGLNEFAVRFPSAFFGSLTVLIVYFLIKELFKNRKLEIGLIASFLLAISPWHIHFSRQAYEVNLALFFISLASLSFFKEKYLISLLLFVLTLFTYHGTVLLAFLLFVYLVFLKRKKDFSFKKLNFYVLLFLLVIIISQFLEKKAIKDKFWQSTVFRDQSLFLERVFIPKLVHQKGDLISKIFHNRIGEGLLAYFENYFYSFSPGFLFFGSDENARFMVYKKSLRLNFLILLPFCLGGIFLILKRRNKKEFFWLFWLLVTPVLPSFLVRSPSSFRNLVQVVPLVVISAFGFSYFLTWIKKANFRVIAIILFLGLLSLDFLKISEEYIFHLQGGLDQYYKEIIENFDYFEKERKKSLIFKASHPEYSPYIFLAFYKNFDPNWFFKNIKRYPIDKEGFEHVASITQKYQFGPIDWGKPVERDVVYLDLYREVPGEIKDIGGKEVRIIKDKLEEPLFFQFVY